MSSTTPFSLTAIVPAIMLETILTRLASLFLTGAAGDITAARDAASHMLASYRPQTEAELLLAANIVAFGLQALEALGQAASAELSLTRVLRLRSGAVSLSREAEKARRALCQLQKARQQAQPIEQPAEAAQAKAEPVPAPSQPAKLVQPAHPQTEEDRQRDLRIADGLKRMEARLAANAGQASILAAAMTAGQTPAAPGRAIAPTA